MLKTLIYIKNVSQKFFLESNDFLYFVDNNLVKVLDKSRNNVKVEFNNSIMLLPPNCFSEMVGYVLEPTWDEDGRCLKIENSSVPFLHDVFSNINVFPTRMEAGIRYKLEFNEDTQKLRIPQDIYFCNEPRFRNLLRKNS